MKDFHLKKSLNLCSDEWLEIFKADYRVDSVHPNRLKGYALAREALLDLLKVRGIELTPKDLRLVNYKQILGLEGFTLSLSHTPLMGAAILVSSDLFRAVGIDIEEISRSVSESVIARVKHPRDGMMNALELWTLKEACFKALMNTGEFEKNIEFSSIQINSNQTWQHSEGLFGTWTSWTEENHHISCAYIKI